MPGNGGNGLEGEQQGCRRVQQAGKVHGILRLRVDRERRTIGTMHRNIFFKDCWQGARRCLSARSTRHTRRICGSGWTAQRKAGNELLAISHNANLSDGHMYPIDVDSYGRPIDAAWAESRDRNERLDRDQADQGTPRKPTRRSRPPMNSPTTRSSPTCLATRRVDFDHIVGSYARQALKDGITMQDTKGYNPYKFGVVGASDSHNTGTPYRQDNFYGGHAALDGTIEGRMAGHVFRRPGYALRESCRSCRSVGRREYPRLDLRCHAAPRDLRGERPAHQAALLWRLGTTRPAT